MESGQKHFTSRLKEMEVVNLTPHSIEVYPEDAFVGLEQVNPSTWVADSVTEAMCWMSLPSKGSLRIATKTVECAAVGGVPTVETTYGDLQGLPSDYAGEWLIVSLPAQSMAKASGHELAAKMVAPYKVVRSRANGSVVLGCMGFTK
jgi:hypothetical protein